jgi:hypothetical protein
MAGNELPATSVDANDHALREAQKVVLPGQTPEGEHILSVLVKRSYEIVPGRRCTRAVADAKILPGDIYYDDPMNSAVKFESDFVPFKIATDVVLHGKAYAPNGRQAQSVIASLQVGRSRKDILVIGDRVCRYREKVAPAFTDPRPFTTMEIGYDRAYGGIDIYSDPKLPCPYIRNPRGQGFVIQNTKKAVERLTLPNVEDPENRLTPDKLCLGHFMHWERQPMPQGFGWYGKSWHPRSSYAGVMPADRATEQQLRTIYAQLVPPAQRQLYKQTKLPDMDFRFFNGASRGLALPFLKGDEEVRLVNLSPQGELRTLLPNDCPRVGLDIGMGLQEPAVFLHTVMVRLEERQLDLVWRAAMPYPGPDWLPEMRKMEIAIA